MPTAIPSSVGLDETVFRQLSNMRSALVRGQCLPHAEADAILRHAVARLFADIAIEVADGPQAEIARMVKALSDAVDLRRHIRPLGEAALRHAEAEAAR